MEEAVRTYIADPVALDISRHEVARYLGYGQVSRLHADDELVKKAVERLRKLAAPKACYCRYDLAFEGENGILLPYGKVESVHLRKNLDGCDQIYIFAATIGAAFDRELARAKIRSMSEAAILQAAGAAAVEALCDELNEKITQEAAESGRQTVRRFSPGYGDLGLENQKGIFLLLDPARRIGLTLMDTMIMSPEKSVTAIIGCRRREE